MTTVKSSKSKLKVFSETLCVFLYSFRMGSNEKLEWLSLKVHDRYQLYPRNMHLEFESGEICDEEEFTPTDVYFQTAVNGVYPSKQMSPTELRAALTSTDICLNYKPDNPNDICISVRHLKKQEEYAKE